MYYYGLCFSEISYCSFNVLKVSFTVIQKFTFMHLVLYWFTAFLHTLSFVLRRSCVVIFSFSYLSRRECLKGQYGEGISKETEWRMCVLLQYDLFKCCLCLRVFYCSIIFPFAVSVLYAVLLLLLNTQTLEEVQSAFSVPCFYDIKLLK